MPRLDLAHLVDWTEFQPRETDPCQRRGFRLDAIPGATGFETGAEVMAKRRFRIPFASSCSALWIWKSSRRTPRAPFQAHTAVALCERRRRNHEREVGMGAQRSDFLLF